MKAFIAYDETGRITSVGIPNPDLGDNVVIEAPEGGSLVTIDVSDVVKGAEQLIFPTDDHEAAKHLQEAVRRITEQHEVDPATRRLIPKKPTREPPETGNSEEG